MMVVKRWFIAEWYRSLANGKKETTRSPARI